MEDYLRRHPGAPIDTFVGRTPEIIALSRACVAVSGSVSLELLWHQTPSVILYRIGRIDLMVARCFIKTPFISLVNLLAQNPIFPEFLTDKCEAAAIADKVLTWLDNADQYAHVRQELSQLRERVAEPGACGRTAEFILTELGMRLAA